MGMYDSIKCEIQLPKLKESGIDLGSDYNFQTKDLECLLDQYKIGSDRKLYRSIQGPDGTKTINFLDGPQEIPVFKHSHWIEYKDVNGLPYHGRVSFYGAKDNWWIVYIATFTNGLCTDIILTQEKHLDKLNT